MLFPEPSTDKPKSPLWLHAELAVNLTPWSWRVSAWRSGRNLTLHAGPLSLVVIDG
jgi:hypothetical protein